jgi:hypothetical protein
MTTVPTSEQRRKDALIVQIAGQYPAFALATQLEFYALSASEALARELGEPRAANKMSRRWRQRLAEVQTSLEAAQQPIAVELPPPATPTPPTPPARRRRNDPNYRLHVESITYLGDDAAAAQAIENFLRLSRTREARGC